MASNNEKQVASRVLPQHEWCAKHLNSQSKNKQQYQAGQQEAIKTSAQHITRATKVRRKVQINPQSIPLSQLLWLLCCLGLSSTVMADCPSVCECKWKSGKESVVCLNANLTHIPVLLDAGTQVLDLTGNDIAIINHDTFAAVNLLNLQKVYLARCHLRQIERFAFRKLINLVELDLSHNLLNSIPMQALQFVPELREIKLNGNPITRVPDNAFLRVPQLVRLELSDCKLSVVEVQAFAGLETSLEWLKLDGNNLSEVRAGTITSLTNLHGIELAHNPWNCSCALRPLRAWMLTQNIPYGVPPLCHAPARLATRTWDKVDLDEFACVPQIIATDTTAHGVEGRNITMSCYVEGVPEPSVRWLIKNRVIANLTAPLASEPAASARTAASTQGRKTYVVNMLRNASNLTILTADMQDAGIYTCAAENRAGKVEASVTLAVSRRPPEPPLSVKIVLLCVFIALFFVVLSSFAAICFCSLRRKRKMRLWNSVPTARTESYEKIELTTRGHNMGNNGGIGGGGGGGGGANGNAGCGGGGKPDLGENAENAYIRAAMTTPLDCGSDDGHGAGDAARAIVNPSSGGVSSMGNGIKRNGEYRNIPTYSDDDGEDNSLSYVANEKKMGTPWSSNTLRSSPQQQHIAAHKKQRVGVDDADLHIPRLIDLGSTTETVNSSISSQVDAASRHGSSYPRVHWSTTPTNASTKITSSHSKTMSELESSKSSANPSSVYTDEDIFDSNYPDLLDIAKYAVAQATNASKYSKNPPTTTKTPNLANGGICTLPRKCKNTGKYFKNSSDSQSPLLADHSSKYGSSQLGDGSFLTDLTMGRRFSAESTYASYTCSPSYTTGQRSNSFLNLVQSCNKGGLGMSSHTAAQLSTAVPVASGGNRRNPSLPSSPVRDFQQKQQQSQQQHQRSFSSAATPLLDFSNLATRATGMTATLPAVVPPTSSVAAYDYHAAQLERFLEEYRNLQDQLCKMKETCDTIRKKEAPLRVGTGHSAQLADPVMFNAANSPTPVPKATMLKNKAILPGQPPDPPPYWLHRNAMLKKLNESTQADSFKS